MFKSTYLTQHVHFQILSHGQRGETQRHAHNQGRARCPPRENKNKLKNARVGTDVVGRHVTRASRTFLTFELDVKFPGQSCRSTDLNLSDQFPDVWFQDKLVGV